MPESQPSEEFDPVQYAKNELSPLLFSLCELAETEGARDQTQFFRAILDGIDRSVHSDHLADPFMQLSMSAFMGFSFSPHVAMLLDLVLERAQRLSEALSNDPSELH